MSSADQPPDDPPAVRLAVGGNARDGGEQRDGAFGDPTVRLAHVPGAQGDVVLLGEKGRERLPDGSRPALLVSFFYLRNFLLKRSRWAIRDWAMDSGAFSAANAGAKIDLVEFTETAVRLLREDPLLTEVFSLDVIGGDWRESERNTEYMWSKGVPAIPAWHQGEPWDVLEGMAREYPKIALGGLVGMRAKAKRELVQECFRRVWAAAGPKRIHGFGLISEETLLSVPFHSVDATNWEIGPCAFGAWKSAGGQQLRIRGSRQPLRAEVEWYLALERRCRERWRREFAKWPPYVQERASSRRTDDGAPPIGRADDAATVRLALSGGGRDGVTDALTAPTIRLAASKPGDNDVPRFDIAFADTQPPTEEPPP